MSKNSAMDVDLRDVQEKVEGSMKQAQDLGRRTMLATVGMWGMAYDKAQELWKSSMELVDKAEKRGEEIEQEWTKQFDKLQENPEVKKVVVYVEDQVDVVSKNSKTVVAEVEKFLAQFQAKADEVAKDVAIKIESIAEAVVPGYDDLSAKEVVAKLGDLPRAKLLEIREYEVKNKNRVTVLREIDVLLESPETVSI